MEAEAYEELYVQLRPSLLSRAWLMLGSRAAAEDVVHECFSQFLQSNTGHVERPSAYLHSMVVNGCLREIRRRRRVQPLRELPEAICRDPEHSEIVELLSELSSRRRAVLVLRYCYGYSVEDIAGLMNCAPSTVSSLIHRAINQLRKSSNARAIAFARGT